MLGSTKNIKKGENGNGRKKRVVTKSWEGLLAGLCHEMFKARATEAQFGAILRTAIEVAETEEFVEE